MIRIDALYLLFLLELVLICIIAVPVLFLKNRKHKLLYQRVLRDLTNLKSSGTQKQLDDNVSKISALDIKLADEHKEKSVLERKVAELEAKVKEENKLLEELKKKHATLENEYSILYGKHFEEKGKINSADVDELLK